jgi:hypothetical protein
VCNAWECDPVAVPKLRAAVPNVSVRSVSSHPVFHYESTIVRLRKNFQ